MSTIGNKKLMLLAAVGLMLAGCAKSPQEKGADLANELVDAYSKVDEQYISQRQQLVNELQNGAYTARAQVRSRDSLIRVEWENQRQAQESAFSSRYQELLSRYSGDFHYQSAFSEAYDSVLYAYSSSFCENVRRQDEEIKKLIQSIVPSAPTAGDIRQSIVDRRITGAENDYLSTSFALISVMPEDIEDVTIESVDNRGQECTVVASLKVKGSHGGKYMAHVRLEYRVNDDGMWELHMLESRGVDVVRTNRYNSCISSEIEGVRGEQNLKILNHTDQYLVVGGTFKDQHEQWNKFSVFVDPNSTATVGAWFFTQVLDYTIDFVELR